MKRAAFLLIFLLATLSMAFLLPPFKNTGSAITLTVPERIEGWRFQAYEASEKERAILAKDTDFSKAFCSRVRWEQPPTLGAPTPVDVADLSIVLSGHDLANSIHRPERCMPTQGHKIYGSSKSTIEVPGHGAVPVRRLLSVQERSEAPDGPVTRHNALTYYFFVGNDTITESHTRRTLIDMQDRLKKGEAQRWAYVSASMSFSPDGSDPRLPDMDLADRKLRELIGNISARNIDWEQIRP
jgi:hypothetical protein